MVRFNKALIAVLLSGTSLLAVSCTSDGNILDQKVPTAETGTLTLSLASNTGFSAQTKSLNEADYRVVDNYDVLIVDANKTKKFEGKYSALKAQLASAPMSLAIGPCSITASYGTESAASRDAFLVTGTTNVNIEGGKNASATLTCSPTCGKIMAAFDAAMATYYSVYNISYTTSATTFKWEATDTEPWYAKLDQAGETVHYTIHLEAKEEYLTQINNATESKTDITGSFELKRNQAHKLTIKPNYSAPTNELGITITIDDSTNDIEKVIEVPISWI